MASLFARFRIILPHAYKNLSQSSLHDSDTKDIETEKTEKDATTSRNLNGISGFHVMFLYTLSLLLAVALAITLVGEAATDCDGALGSYERGFKTEIRGLF